MECQVLRCSNDAQHPINVSPDESLVIETVVCGEHKAAMDSGQPWVVDGGQPEGLQGTSPEPILTGDDLVTRNLRVWVSTTIHGGGSYSGNDGFLRLLEIHTRVLGSTETGTIELLVPPDSVQRIQEDLEWLKPPSGDLPDM